MVKFARSIFLVRLLEPKTFGTYSFAASIVIWTAAIPKFGLGSALVHRAKESDGELARRVHFTLVLLFSLAWAVGLIFVGVFFLDADVQWVFRILVFSQFSTNLNQTVRSKLVRAVNFRRMALIGTANTILAAVLAVYLAWQGFGIWSLVSTDVVITFGSIIGYYVIRPVWRPRLGWSGETVRYFLSFGRRSFLSGPLMRTLDRFDDIWVGAFLGETALGYYSRAYRFASYPRNFMANPISRVAAGTYAELKEQPKRLSQAFFRVNAVLIRSGFLLGGLMALVAPEFIRIVMGVKWLPMLDVFRLMLVFTLLDPLKASIASLFPAMGKPEKVVHARVIQLVVMLSGLFTLGPHWGIEGVAVTVNLMLFVGIALLLWKARAHVRFSVKRMFLFPSLALFFGMGFGRLAIILPGVLGSPWRTGSVKSIVFCLVYLSILLVFERTQIQMMIELVRKVFPLPNARISE